VSGEGERARLFVALELPLPVRAALVRWRDRAVGGFDGLRLIGDADLHVTLCFLGWQPLTSASAVLAACQVVVGRPSAPLRVLEAIWLPPRRPRVLAVELADETGALAEVQQALSDALADGGWYVPEKRPFLAHVTVARVARGGRVGRGAAMSSPPGVAFKGTQVTLFRSRLSAAGARYEALGSARLEGGQD
jgi:2'-5' RNA ligase